MLKFFTLKNYPGVVEGKTTVGVRHWHGIIISNNVVPEVRGHVCFQILQNKLSRRCHLSRRSKARTKYNTIRVNKFASLCIAPATATSAKRGTMFATGDHVFEFDSDEHKSKSNPGYGPCAGVVVDPHLSAGPGIEWVDGLNPGPVAKKNLVKAPAPFTPFKALDDQVYTVHEYTKDGVTFTISQTMEDAVNLLGNKAKKRRRTLRGGNATLAAPAKQKKIQQEAKIKRQEQANRKVNTKKQHRPSKKQPK